MPIAQLVPSPIAATAHADAILELAFLVSAVDGHLAEEELAAFGQLVGAVRGREPSAVELDDLLGRFLMAVQSTPGEDRVRQLSAALPGELRETAFKIAIGLTLVDHEENEHEDVLVGILAASLGLAERSIPLTAEARAAFGD
jgi:Tellurite resistance protein TerB